MSNFASKINFQANGAELHVESGGKLVVEAGGQIVNASHPVVHNVRKRFTAAEVNAGITLIPAVAGYKIRLVDWTMIAIGGNAATAASVDIAATQSASGALLAIVAVAALTRSTPVKPNSANVTNLADGAGFVANDANTAVTVIKGGSNLATATHVDVIAQYVLEPA